MKDLRSFKSLEPSLGRFMIFPDSVDLKDLASQDTDLVSSDDYRSAFLGFLRGFLRTVHFTSNLPYTKSKIRPPKSSNK